MLKGARHRVFAANRRQPERHLHLQRTEQGGERFAVGVRVVRHALEVFLIGETHAAVIGAGCHHLGASLHDGVGSAMVRAPFGQERVVAECHNRGGVGKAVGRQLLHRHLRLGLLACAAKGHQHRAAADRGIEFLDKSFLRGDIGVGEVGGELLEQRVARRRAAEGVVVLDGVDGGVGIVLGARAVDKFTLQVGHERAVIVLTHTTRVGDIRHVGYLDIVLATEALHRLTVFGLDHHRHALLRFGNGQLGRVEPRIFGRHTVEIDV